MHVSRKTDYAVRSLAYLASQPDRRILIAEVAQAMAIPRPFLSKIMKELVAAELVTSQTGPGGGYRLSRTPGAISFRDIVEVVEGPWALVPCQADGGDEACVLQQSCSQVSVWDSIRLEMLKVLGNYSLDGVQVDDLNRGAGAELFQP